MKRKKDCLLLVSSKCGEVTEVWKSCKKIYTIEANINVELLNCFCQKISLVKMTIQYYWFTFLNYE